MYKHIFFDLDGTLWDFHNNTRDTIFELYHSYGFHESLIDFENWYEAYKKHNVRLWEGYAVGEVSKQTLRDTRFYLALKDFGLDNAELGREFGQRFVDESPRRTTLFDNAHEVLAYLHEKYGLHIITNGFSEIQFQKLKNTGLDAYFTNVYVSDIIGYHKPHQEIYRHAVTSLHAAKSECIMVGDDFKADIIGAKEYGIDQVFFRHNDKEYDLTPTYEIRSLIELKNFL